MAIQPGERLPQVTFAEFASAVGLAMGGSARGFGTRSRRYAMVVDDGVVLALSVEESPRDVDVSGADAVLAKLDALR